MKTFAIAVFLLFIGLSGETEFSGSAEMMGRISYHKNPEFLKNRIFVETALSGKLNEKASYLLKPSLYSDFSKEIFETNNLTDKMYFSQMDLGLNEAYAKLTGFPFQFADVTVGRQVVSIGAGDVISPIDIINPDDLSDPLKFDKKIGKEILSVECYTEILNLSFYYSPIFKPSLLFGGFLNLEEQFQGVDYINDSIMMPSGIFESSDLFVAVSKDFAAIQTSVFYGYTRTHTPMPYSLSIEMVSMTSAKADINFFFPRMHTCGISFSGSAGDAGIWMDLSANYISQTDYVIDMSGIGGGIADTFSMKDNLFLKGLAGCDFTFPGGLYVSCQYSHGMRGEYGEELMHDYIFFGSRISLMNERVLIEPVNLSYEICDFKLIAKSGAVVLYPKVTFKTTDNLEISAAMIFVEGTANTNFNKLNDQDAVELIVKYYF